MKKAINKSERAAIIQCLVVDACLKNGKKVVEGLMEQFNIVKSVCQQSFDAQVPELSARKRQLELLQQRVLNNADPRLTVAVWKTEYNEKAPSWKFRDFGHLVGTVPSRSDAVRQQDSILWFSILNSLPSFGKFASERYLGHSTPSFTIKTTFSDVPASPMTCRIYDTFAPTLQHLPAEVSEYNSTLYTAHHEILVLFSKLFDILLGASAMRDELQAVFAPIKTPTELAELFPEAVKHFPESMSYVRPTKELADPAAINEIRAKLKAGLPI